MFPFFFPGMSEDSVGYKITFRAAVNQNDAILVEIFRNTQKHYSLLPFKGIFGNDTQHFHNVIW